MRHFLTGWRLFGAHDISYQNRWFFLPHRVEHPDSCDYRPAQQHGDERNQKLFHSIPSVPDKTDK